MATLSNFAPVDRDHSRRRSKLAYLFPAIGIFVAGCTTLVYQAVYDVDVSSVERRKAGEVKSFNDVHGHTFEDEYVRVTWTPTQTNLGVLLVNKTDSLQRVAWDEIIYIGPDGKSDHIVHQSADLGAAMPPTSVAPGSTLRDFLEPARHTYWRSMGGPGHPYDAPLIANTFGPSEANVRSKMVHGTLTVLLPIAMNDTTREYVFHFVIKGGVILRGYSS